MAIFLYCFILLWCFLVKTYAYIQCGNDRACSDGYECDPNTNGTFCCFNSSCDSVRSSWSLLSSNCLYPPYAHCPLKHYCRKTTKYCITKQIATCDGYLEMESKVRCGSDGYLIKRGFEMCNTFYLKKHDYNHPEQDILMCTESCIQKTIAMSIFKRERDCDVISEQAFSNYSRCFASCGGCLLQESWDLILDYFPTERMQDVAKRCAFKFREASNEECPSLTRKRTESFIQKTKNKMNIDVSEYFMEFIGTTTIEATISDTTIAESTSSDPTTFDPTTSESPNFETLSNEIDSSNICEFRNGQFQLTCLQLSLIAFVMLILILFSLLSVYKFSSRTYMYKPNREQNFEMNLIANDIH